MQLKNFIKQLTLVNDINKNHENEPCAPTKGQPYEWIEIN